MAIIIACKSFRSIISLKSLYVFTLLPVFYAGEVGVGLALTGLVLFASRALDVVTDPFIGYLAGGGIVWFVRIGGTLAFGREAIPSCLTHCF